MNIGAFVLRAKVKYSQHLPTNPHSKTCIALEPSTDGRACLDQLGFARTAKHKRCFARQGARTLDGCSGIGTHAFIAQHRHIVLKRCALSGTRSVSMHPVLAFANAKIPAVGTARAFTQAGARVQTIQVGAVQLMHCSRRHMQVLCREQHTLGGILLRLLGVVRAQETRQAIPMCKGAIALCLP